MKNMMSDSVKRIKEELESIGYETESFNSAIGMVVAFNYVIETGSHKGTSVLVGVSFQEEGYPVYPPHWIHVSPPIEDGKGGSVRSYDNSGRRWLAMSRPPGRVWDQLKTKHMYGFISEHLRRIWKDV